MVRASARDVRDAGYAWFVEHTGIGYDRRLVSGKRMSPALSIRRGQVAQSVEQRIENPRVGGSIPPLATK
jgi:hypothetical protein